MKARRLWTAAMAVVVVAAALASAAWRAWTRPASTDGPGTQVLVQVPEGMSLGAAADTLVARGLLADARVLLVGARLTGQDRNLKSGLYALGTDSSPREILAALTSGRGVQHRVTVPEGLDADEVAARMAQALDIDPERFLARADSLVGVALANGRIAGGRQAGARLDSLLARQKDLLPRRLRRCEGYLAPDTYLFAAGTSAEAVAAHLVSTQLVRLEQAMQKAGPEVPGGHELLVLASVVEAEARRDDERARIAAVYSNRLARGMRLEADPTVAHVLGKKGQRLLYRDLDVDSAWNTYRVRGLPPGPIGSPGLASLVAAARPAEDCEALFFVADGADGHVFSRTAAEHEEAVRRFRRLRAAERRDARD